MNYQIKHALVLMLVLSMAGCKTARHIQMAERTSTDTVYIKEQFFDSVYIEKSREIEHRKADTTKADANYRSIPDTVFILERVTEFHYKQRTDSSHSVHSDSIPIADASVTNAYIKAMRKEERTERREQNLKRLCCYGFVILGLFLLFRIKQD